MEQPVALLLGFGGGQVVLVVPGARVCLRGGCGWSGGGSASAAGQLGHVAGEGLRGQFQRLGHGQVRGPQVGQLLDGHTRGQDVHAGGGQLTGGLGRGVHAEDAAGVGVGDEFDNAASVPVDERPGQVLQVQDPAVAGVAGCEGLLVGQPDRGDRRGGEGDPGQGCVVHATAGAGQGVVNHGGAVGGGDVHVLGCAGDVT